MPFLLFGFISLILALVIFTFPQKFNHQVVSKSNGKIKKEKKLKKNGLNGSLKHENELVSLNANNQENDNVSIKMIDAETQSKKEKPNEFLDALENTGSLLSLNKLGAKSSRIDLTNLNEEESQETTILDSSQSEKLNQEKLTTKTLLESSLSLLKKPVYVLIIIATTIEGLLQNSFLAFAALFLEYQYRLASGTASFVLGLLSIPPLMIGGILSGIIVKRLKYRMNDCLKFLGIVLLINIVVYSGFMIYCKEPNMIPNSEQLRANFETTPDKDFSNSTSYQIAQNCNCNRKIFKPVCLKKSDDIFFQTACLAGCTDFNRDTDQFMKCTQEKDSYIQIESDSSDEKSNPIYSNYFISGLCPTSNCDLKLIVSYACIFFLMLLNALTFLPYLKVTIGSIDCKEMNPIGLGLKQFFMNGFGNLIIIFLYWRKAATQVKS